MPDGTQRNFEGLYPGPYAHLRLYDNEALNGLILRGEIGFADAYAEGRWSSNNLSELLTFGLMNAPVLEQFFHGKAWYVWISRLYSVLQKNSLAGSRRNIMSHYDLGNAFYSLWLDKSMTYSCALFEGDANRTLEEAQQAKYRRALHQLDLKAGSHILDVGCGWGGFAEYAARNGMKVTAITISPQQADYARQRMAVHGLGSQAEILLSDYRRLKGHYDGIVSIGMFEHVGEAYWNTYFTTLKRLLRPGGKALVQTITLDDTLYETLHGYSGFIEQVIFPGGMLPSPSRFRMAAQKAGLACEETYAFGKDYARTAQLWLDRFNARKEEVQALGYDDTFQRLWRFYLSACIAVFSSGRTSVMQARLHRKQS